MPVLNVFIDGSCQPCNPNGYGCWAWLAIRGDKLIEQRYGCLGRGQGVTNNVAEWRAMIQALKWLDCKRQHLEAHALTVVIHSDSQLVVRQINGVYAVAAEHLLPLYEQARQLMQGLPVTVKWIPREQNEQADALTRRAHAEARAVAA